MPKIKTTKEYRMICLFGFTGEKKEPIFTNSVYTLEPKEAKEYLKKTAYGMKPYPLFAKVFLAENEEFVLFDPIIKNHPDLRWAREVYRRLGVRGGEVKW